MGMEILLLLGTLMVALPVIIMGCVVAWRERQYEKEANKNDTTRMSDVGF